MNYRSKKLIMALDHTITFTKEITSNSILYFIINYEMDNKRTCKSR